MNLFVVMFSHSWQIRDCSMEWCFLMWHKGTIMPLPLEVHLCIRMPHSPLEIGISVLDHQYEDLISVTRRISSISLWSNFAAPCPLEAPLPMAYYKWLGCSDDYTGLYAEYHTAMCTEIHHLCYTFIVVLLSDLGHCSPSFPVSVFLWNKYSARLTGSFWLVISLSIYYFG